MQFVPNQNEDFLKVGTVLENRFEILQPLGRDKFEITYLASDGTRGDKVIVKELAPENEITRAEANIHFRNLSDTACHRLRRLFINEANNLARLNLRGIPNYRAEFSANGTAYFVTEYFKDAQTLKQILQAQKRLITSDVLHIIGEIADTLECTHSRKILHLNLNPENILVRENGHILVTGFAVARQWYADFTQTQSHIYELGIAATEQFSERLRRGPATDIYGICTIGFQMLTGESLQSDQVVFGDHEANLPAFLSSEADFKIFAAIKMGIAPDYEARPSSVSEWRKILVHGRIQDVEPTLPELDQRLVELQRLKTSKCECPSCGEVLMSPKPLGNMQCPVCKQGKLTKRELHPDHCPVCRSGVLHLADNTLEPKICPICLHGRMKVLRKGLLHPIRTAICPDCESNFQFGKGDWRLSCCQINPDRIGETHSWQVWRETSGIAEHLKLCDGCEAIFELEPDGRWKLAYPIPKSHDPRTLYPEEWARVAARLDPGSGTHVCTVCNADFFLDSEKLTLLHAEDDPFQYARFNLGRCLSLEEVIWLGAGKESRNQGLTCFKCHTEFDQSGLEFRLVRSYNEQLERRAGESHNLPDWHRIAKNLPLPEEESSFLELLDFSVIKSYREAQIDLDSKGLIWKGIASKQDSDRDARLTVTEDEVTFGGVLRKEKFTLSALESAHGFEHKLTLQFANFSDALELEIDPITFIVQLDSGARSVSLDASDLAARLQKIIQEHDVAQP